MLVRLLSAVQMWHLKTPLFVLNCLLSKHFFKLLKQFTYSTEKKHELSRGYFKEF